MAMVIVTNNVLGPILGPGWETIRLVVLEDGRRLHVAHDVCRLLNFSNVNGAVGHVHGRYRIKHYVQDVNARRPVHLLTLPGVFQLIMNARNDRCKAIRNYLATMYLPSVEGLVLYQQAEVNATI